MTSHKRIATPDDSDTALLKAVALDIGKEIVARVESMYPQAISASSSTFPLSLRNSIYNEIMAAMKVTDPAKIQTRLAERAKHRREMKRMQGRLRDTDWEAVRADPGKQEAEWEDIKRDWWRDENQPEPDPFLSDARANTKEPK